MEEPNYKLAFQEGILVPKYESRAKDMIKLLLTVSLALGILLTLLPQRDIPRGITILLWACVLISVLYLLSHSGHRWVPSECELWFYEDRLVHYRPKRYYSRKKARREYYVFQYQDIKSCIYRSVVQKVDIFGVLEGIYYDYDEHGHLSGEPSYHKTVDALTRFYVTFEPDIDFIEIIEKHSPVKVEISNS